MAKVALVTGASSGIGLATARALLEKGYVVYGLCRHEPPEAAIRFLPGDVTEEGQVQDAFEQLREEAGRLDLLVNNAGFGIAGPVELTELGAARRQFEVNVLGGLNCSKAALPLLRESRGKIINISSVAAVFSIPFQGFYSASKAAVNALTLACRNEVKPFGVQVCALMPGDVHTGFTGAREKSADLGKLYAGADKRSLAVMEKDEKNGMAPERLGAFVVKLAGKKRLRPLYTLGAKYHLFCLLGKLLPTGLVNWLVGKLYIQ